MTGSTARRSAPRPSLRLERSYHREGLALVAGMDEVGRGALAGPVSVGVVVVTADMRSAPVGVRDSKLVPASRRAGLVPRVQRWAHAYGVGHASPGEIDAHGILAALRLAGMRALLRCGITPDVVLLDGKHDWLSSPVVPVADVAAGRPGEQALFDLDVVDAGPPARSQPAWPDVAVPTVRTRIKADMACSSVAAASILAKVERDAHMVDLARRFPAYGWEINKGYAAPEHRSALASLGTCEQHRRSWRLQASTDQTDAHGSPPSDRPVQDGIDPVTDVPAAMGHDGAVKVRLT